MYGKIQQHLQEELQAIQDNGLFKKERIITSPQGAEITISTGETVLNFCANNYLGLSSHPEVVQAAKDALDSHGFGMSSVRFICGTQDIHKTLEQKIANFYGTEDTILYAAAFDANGGVFEPLLGAEDCIISDSLNHASIIDGVRLCKAARYRYENSNMEDLEAQLIKATEEGRRFKLIVAFTRAVEQLYVISEIKINKDGKLPNTLSSYIIEYLQLNKNFNENQFEYEFGNPVKVSKNEEVVANLDEIQVVQNKIKTSAIKIAQKEALMWGTIQAEAIEFGNTLHEILSYIKTSEDIKKAITISLEKGLINQSQVNIIEEVINSIVNHTELEKFYSNEAKIYNETSIIDENKTTFIPDRIAIKDNKAYLLDYKTGIPKENHKHQVEKYESLLQKMGYSVEEKALVYLGENLKIIHL